MSDWLTEEEQYQEFLNDKQISRIKDPELREIRMRHWKYQTKIFLDENNISDEEFNRLAEEDIRREKEEIRQYKLKRIMNRDSFGCLFLIAERK